jgi:pimeloyl-ACP methyl ester carboxylesterase
MLARHGDPRAVVGFSSVVVSTWVVVVRRGGENLDPQEPPMRRNHTYPLILLALLTACTKEKDCPPAPAATDKPAAAPAVAAPAPAATKKTGHAEVNGLRYYYEIHGEGEPLLVLHGGLGSIDMFGPILPELAKGHQVIAVDLHGHGRTALGDRKISLVDIADDLAGVLDHLGVKQVDAFGYSFGGGAALRLAVQHPDKVRKLVVASAPFAREGFYPEMLPQQAAVGAGMAEMMKETPMYRSYVAVAPKPDDFPRLLDAMGELMRTPYDWADDVKTLKMPVLLVYGDSDMIRLDHVVEFYNLLGGGLKDAGWQREHMAKNRLAIIPDLTHYEVFMSPLLVPTVLDFVDGKSNQPTWSDQVPGK